MGCWTVRRGCTEQRCFPLHCDLRSWVLLLPVISLSMLRSLKPDQVHLQIFGWVCPWPGGLADFDRKITIMCSSFARRFSSSLHIFTSQKRDRRHWRRLQQLLEIRSFSWMRMKLNNRRCKERQMMSILNGQAAISSLPFEDFSERCQLLMCTEFHARERILIMIYLSVHLCSNMSSKRRELLSHHSIAWFSCLFW